MSIPLVLLCGTAGSGKGAVADILVKHFNATEVAQADPLKRFCMDVFQFSEEQLWGPSEFRDVADKRYQTSNDPNLAKRISDEAIYNFNGCYKHWLACIGIPESDAIARQLWEWFEGCMAQADNLSPRLVLQTLGTEFGRKQDIQVWIRNAHETAIKLLRGGYRYDRRSGTQCLIESSGPYPDFVVISDGRFRNEVVATLERGGETWFVEGRKRDLPVGKSAHQSETQLGEVPRHMYTHTINNSGSLQYLNVLVADAMSYRLNADHIVFANKPPMDFARLVKRSGG